MQKKTDRDGRELCEMQCTSATDIECGKREHCCIQDRNKMREILMKEMNDG